MRSIIIILLTVVYTFSFAQSKKDSNVYTRVNSNTFFIIEKQTEVVTSGDLELYSPITGQGLVKLIDKKDTKIDAHNNAINNLVIDKSIESQTTITSTLNINQKLHLKKGEILLFDFDIVIGEYAQLRIEKESKMLFLGEGKIHHTQPTKLLAHSLPTIEFQSIALFKQEIKHFSLEKKNILHHKVKKVIFLNKRPPTSPA